jgi:SAM-dependent methyltransferase
MNEQDREVTAKLRQARDQVRREVEEGFAEALRRQQDGEFLYGDRDVQLFPQLRQHLDQVEALQQVHEQPFLSTIPLVGRLIAWFRERWNRVAAKWYVRALLQQQNHFNAAVSQALWSLYQYNQRASHDLVLRTDALFNTLQQQHAALAAMYGDMEESGQLLRQEMIAALREERKEALVEMVEAIRQEQEARIEAWDSHLRTALWQSLAQFQEKAQQIAHEQQVDRRELAFLRIKMDRLMSRMAGPETIPTEQRAEIQSERESLLDHHYYRFELLYRSEEQTRELQRMYLPYFQGHENVLDLGCGKGEFLELLREEGIEAYGVDLNEQMVRACQEKDLRAVLQDGLVHVASLADSSIGGLFAAHLVEHISPNALAQLGQQAYTKLKPDAYLIFETPNPLCLWALVNYFYLDMTHVKPVHPQSLKLLLETCGFRDVEIRFLHPVPEGVRMALLPDAGGTAWQEMAALLNTNLERLNDLLYGYADYAIIARK